MAVLAVDLGGTKLALAVFAADATVLYRQVVPLAQRKGAEVGRLITDEIRNCMAQNPLLSIQSIGVCVPGISHKKEGTVWAPNISGWDDYPLQPEIEAAVGSIPVAIDSDRACYILGERWQGAAQGCKDAVFLAVGTGIGAGILVNGNILRGANDIAGAIGWMALQRPYKSQFKSCGCFEHQASGEGIAKVARLLLEKKPALKSELRSIAPGKITAAHVFEAYEKRDAIATEVIQQCIRFWGMAVANLVSLFNPQKIILGGGVFGPACRFIDAITTEAKKWAQPIAVQQVQIERSALGNDAGLYGAGYLALQQGVPV